MPTTKEMQEYTDPLSIQVIEEGTGFWSDPLAAIANSGSWQRWQVEKARRQEAAKNQQTSDFKIGSAAFDDMNAGFQFIGDAFLHEPWLFGSSPLEVMGATMESYERSARFEASMMPGGDTATAASLMKDFQTTPDLYGSRLDAYETARDPATYGMTDPEQLKAARMAPLAGYGFTSMYQDVNALNIEQNYSKYMQHIVQRDEMIAAGEAQVAELYALAKLNNPLTEQYQASVLNKPGAVHPRVEYNGTPMTSEQLYQNAVMQEAELFRVKNLSPQEWLVDNISIANQMTLNSIFDPTEILGAGFEAFSLTKLGRTMSKADNLYDVANGATNVEMAARAADPAHLLSARQPGILSSLNPFGLPASSQAELSLDTWDILGSALGRAMQDKSDVAYLAEQVVRSPGDALRNGIDVAGIPSFANQADSAGRYHLSGGLWANKSAVQNWDVFEAVKDKIVDLPSLRGSGNINVAAFQEEWTGLFARGTNDFYGVGQPSVLAGAAQRGMNNVASFVGGMVSNPGSMERYSLLGGTPPAPRGFGPMQGPMPWAGTADELSDYAFSSAEMRGEFPRMSSVVNNSGEVIPLPPISDTAIERLRNEQYADKMRYSHLDARVSDLGNEQRYNPLSGELVDEPIAPLSGPRPGETLGGYAGPYSTAGNVWSDLAGGPFATKRPGVAGPMSAPSNASSVMPPEPPAWMPTEAPAWLDETEASYVVKDRTPVNFPGGVTPDYPTWLDYEDAPGPIKGGNDRAWGSIDVWMKGSAAEPPLSTGSDFMHYQDFNPHATQFPPEIPLEGEKLAANIAIQGHRPDKALSPTSPFGTKTEREEAMRLRREKEIKREAAGEWYDVIEAGIADPVGAQTDATWNAIKAKYNVSAAGGAGLPPMSATGVMQSTGQMIGDSIGGVFGLAKDLNDRQRSAQVELMITSSPASWIGNAGTAQFNAGVDGIGNYRVGGDIENRLRNTGMTRRAAESVPYDASMSRNQDFASVAMDTSTGPSVFDGLAYLNDESGTIKRNPLAQASSYATTLWTGNREIAGRIGFGEANNYNRAFEATQSIYVEKFGEPIIRGQADEYMAAGLTEAQATEFTDYMADAMLDDPKKRGDKLAAMENEINSIQGRIRQGEFAPGLLGVSDPAAEIMRLRGDLSAKKHSFQIASRDVASNAGRGYYGQLGSEYLDNMLGGNPNWAAGEQGPVNQARAAAQDVFAQQTLPAYDTAIGGANKAATDMARFTMLDSSIKNNLVGAAGMITPFANYGVNSVLNTARRIGSDPALLSKYSIVNRSIAEQNDRDEVTLRDEGTFSFEIAGQQFRARNPIDRLLFPASALLGNDMYDETIEEAQKEGNQIKEGVAWLGKVGLPPSWVQGVITGVNPELTIDEMSPTATAAYYLGMSALSGYMSTQPTGSGGTMPSASREPVSNANPLNWLTGIGDIPGGYAQSLPDSLTPGMGGDFTDFGFGRYARQQVQAGTYTVEEGKAIIDYLERLQNGLPAMPGETGETVQQANAIISGYSQELGISALTSTLLGVRIRPVSEGEQSLHDATVMNARILDISGPAELGQTMGDSNQVWDAWKMSVAENPGTNPALGDATAMLIPGLVNEDGYTRPAEIPIKSGKDIIVPGQVVPGDEYAYPRVGRRPMIPDLPVSQAANINPNAIVSLGGPYSTLGDSPFTGGPNVGTKVSGPTIADGLPGVDIFADGPRVGTQEVATWTSSNPTTVPFTPYSLAPQHPGSSPKRDSADPSASDLDSIPEVGPATIEKLNDAGYMTRADLSRATREEIDSIEGISTKAVDAIYQATREVATDNYFVNLASVQGGILKSYRGLDNGGGTPQMTASEGEAAAPVQQKRLTWQEELELQPNIGPVTAKSLAASYSSWAELANADPKDIDKNIKGFGEVLSGSIVTEAQRIMANGGVNEILEEERRAFVYTLVDPRDDTIHYVGKTIQRPIDRFEQHLTEDVPSHGINHPKTAWIRDLLQDGLAPEMRIIEEVTEAQLDDREEMWIGYFMYGSGVPKEQIGNVENTIQNDPTVLDFISRETYEAKLLEQGVSEDALDVIWRGIPNLHEQIGIDDGHGGLRAPMDYTTAGMMMNGTPSYGMIDKVNAKQEAALEAANYSNWTEIVAGGEAAAMKRLEKLPEVGPVAAQNVYDYALSQIANGYGSPAPGASDAKSEPNKSPSKTEAAKSDPGYTLYIPTYGTEAKTSSMADVLRGPYDAPAVSTSDILRGPYDAPKEAGSVADVLRGPYEAPASSSGQQSSDYAGIDFENMTMGEALTIAGKLGHVPQRMSGPSIDMTGGGPSNPHDAVTGVWGIGVNGVLTPLSEVLGVGSMGSMNTPSFSAPAAVSSPSYDPIADVLRQPYDYDSVSVEQPSIADRLRGPYSHGPAGGSEADVLRGPYGPPAGSVSDVLRGPYGPPAGSIADILRGPYDAGSPGGNKGKHSMRPQLGPKAPKEYDTYFPQISGGSVPYNQSQEYWDQQFATDPQVTSRRSVSDRVRGPYEAPVGSVADILRGEYGTGDTSPNSESVSDRLRGPYNAPSRNSVADVLRGPYDAPTPSGYNPHGNSAGNSGPNALRDGTLHQFTNPVLKPGVLPGQEFYIESMMRDDGVEVKWDINAPGYWTYNGSTVDPNRGSTTYNGVQYGNAPYSAGSIAVASVMGGSNVGKPFAGDHPQTQAFGVNAERYKSWGGHMGLDYSMPVGTEVTASQGGTVIDTGYSPEGGTPSRPGTGGYGNWAIVQYPGGYVGEYAHFSETMVKPGDVIKPGQVIGLSGDTGVSDFPHLHFGVRKDGEYVDPNEYYNSLAAAAPAAGATDAKNPYAKEMAAAGAKYGLPPGLVESIAAHETSGYDPKAVSPAGAVGVMQIMPITWQQAQDNVKGLDDPTDPLQSIEAGAYYLDWLRDTLPEDKQTVEWIATAYNWGPNRVLGANSPSEAPPETQAYAQSIAGQVGNNNAKAATDWRYVDKNPSPEGFFNFEAFPGMSVDKERTLYASGITSPGALAGMSQANVEELPGFGKKSAPDAIKYANEVMAMGGVIPPQATEDAKAADGSGAKKVKDENIGAAGYYNFEQHKGVSAVKEQALYDAGITTKQQFLAADYDTLDAIPDWGSTTIRNVTTEMNGTAKSATAKEGAQSTTYNDNNVSEEGYYNFEIYDGVGPTTEQAFYDAGITTKELLMAKDAEWVDENITGFGPKNSPILMSQVRGETLSKKQIAEAERVEKAAKVKPSLRPDPSPQEFQIAPVTQVTPPKASEFAIEAPARARGARGLTEAKVSAMVDKAQDAMLEELLKTMGRK